MLVREPIGASQALEWGLVDEVVAAGELEPACSRVAAGLT